MNDTPIVKPVKGKRTPPLGPVAVMAAPKPDIKLLIPALCLTQAEPRSLFTGNLYAGGDGQGGVSLAGPFLGAPQAAMLMETLASRGVRQFVFAGWCGSVAEGVTIGDIVIPIGGIVDDSILLSLLQSGWNRVTRDLLELDRFHYLLPAGFLPVKTRMSFLIGS